MWELAHAVWLNAQLFDDDWAELHALPTSRDRLIVAARICDGYRVPHRDRSQLADAMIEVAVRTAAQEAADSGVTYSSLQPHEYGQLGGGPPLSGHELTWAMAWRIRSARWMIENRSRIAGAIG
jgi:hypothetical protein